MSIGKIAAKKSLAVTMALAIFSSAPMSAWSQNTSIGYHGTVPNRAFTPKAAVPLSLGNFLLNTAGISPALRDLFREPITLVPVPGLVAPPFVIPEHPVISFLNSLQANGMALPQSLSTSREMAQFINAIAAMPDGSAKQAMISMADAVKTSNDTGSSTQMGDIFDAQEKQLTLADTGAHNLGHALGAHVNLQSPSELKPADVRFVPSPESLPESTAQIPDVEKQIVGQEKALVAMKFGLTMAGPRYNLFIVGNTGSGRETALRHMLPAIAAGMPTPGDRVVATNFKDNKNPIILDLETGHGQMFKDEIKNFVLNLKSIMPDMLSSNASKAAKNKIMAPVQAAVVQRKATFDSEIKSLELANGGGIFGIEFFANPADGGGMMIGLHLTRAGKVVDPKKVDEMIAAGNFNQAQFDAASLNLKTIFPNVADKFTAMMEENKKEIADAREQISQFEKNVVEMTVSRVGEPLMAAVVPEIEDSSEIIKPPLTSEQQKAVSYVQMLLGYAINNYHLFMDKIVAPPAENGIKDAPNEKPLDAMDFFKVSVLSNNAGKKGAPMIWVENPTLENVFGKAYDNRRRGIIPGVGLVKGGAPGGPTFEGGAIHKAEGGFLIMHFNDVIRAPGLHQALMVAAKSGQAEMVEGGLRGLMDGAIIHHIPSKVKIVLIGSPVLYRLFASQDHDFLPNFKALANFQSSIKVGAESIAGYAQFFKQSVLTIASEINRTVMNLTRGAMSALIEHGAFLVASNKRLTANFGDLYDTIREATQAAYAADQAEVSRQHVDEVLRAKEVREGINLKDLLEKYGAGKRRVLVSGKVQGQVNGLAVSGPIGVILRTTASAFYGKRGIHSIDEGADLLGPIAKKAAANTAGALAAEISGRLLRDVEISLSYEQSYGGVEGDSASQTQYIAALSALSGVPIKQNLAITGSLDQRIQTQIIGGVIEKIQTFFALCQHYGLTGDQGVIIPNTNIGDLELSPEIVKAVREGKFHIYPVDNVRQAAELLTGISYKELIAKAREGAAAISRGTLKRID